MDRPNELRKEFETLYDLTKKAYQLQVVIDWKSFALRVSRGKEEPVAITEPVIEQKVLDVLQEYNTGIFLSIKDQVRKIAKHLE